MIHNPFASQAISTASCQGFIYRGDRGDAFPLAALTPPPHKTCLKKALPCGTTLILYASGGTEVLRQVLAELLHLEEIGACSKMAYDHTPCFKLGNTYFV